MSSTAIRNIITKNTTKEEMREVYKTYPNTTPKGGFENFHTSTVEPIFCEVPENCKVLDIGCNSGEMMRMLRDSKKCDVTGIDLSETALKIAREKGLNVLYADAEEIPFNDKTFDIIIIREVLSHIHEPLKALKEMRRVLKDDGVLLGSTPHANLERVIWEEQRLHHRYYDEKTLNDALSSVFNKSYIRVLNGAQFSIGFANSMLSDRPAEMLFKCGGDETKPWDYGLLSDKETLRVWMGPTQPPADAYYRMIGAAIKMRQMKGVEVGFDAFSWKSSDGSAEWQEKIRMNSDGNPTSMIAIDSLEKCLKIANPWVFQITYYEDILSFFEVAKQIYPDKKFITECDDWIFDIPSYNVASHPYRPSSGPELIAYNQYKMSDAIIVSTSYLKENFEKMFPDKPIYIIPNSIDFDLWDNCLSDEKMAKKKDDVIRIIYTGCANHNGDMEIVKPSLLMLLDEFPNLEVLIAQDFGCFNDVKNPRLKILKTWANIIDYPSMLKGWDADIGIAPLRDNAFNRAKSNLRWLEYSALKIPSVVSNVRPFSESIKSGEDGYIVKNKNEWYETLKKLIEDKELRKKVGLSAYNRVKKDYNMDKVAEEYVSILKVIRNAS